MLTIPTVGTVTHVACCSRAGQARSMANAAKCFWQQQLAVGKGGLGGLTGMLGVLGWGDVVGLHAVHQEHGVVHGPLHAAAFCKPDLV